MSQSLNNPKTGIHHKNKAHVDVFVENVYDESRKYGCVLTEDDEIIDIKIEVSTDTFNRHTLQRRATRLGIKEVNRMNRFDECIFRNPNAHWNKLGLALGNPEINFRSKINRDNSRFYKIGNKLTNHTSMADYNVKLAQTSLDIPKEIKLFTDGSGCQSETLSCGWVITNMDNEVLAIEGENLKNQGCNTTDAELLGVINALSRISKDMDIQKVYVKCDTMYPIRKYKHFRGSEFKSKALKSLIEETKKQHYNRVVKFEEISRDDNIADIPAGASTYGSFSYSLLNHM